MKTFSALFFVLALAGCKNDQFIQEYNPYVEGRYNKNYKLDTTTNESYAVDVDILWVIDNSGSMRPYQNRVIANSDIFIRQFAASSRLRWKMGLISTSYNEPPYVGFNTVLDWQTPDPAQVFNSGVARLGINGDVFERTFDPTINVLDTYPNWMRPNAYFILVIVSDELEQSRMDVNSFISRIAAKTGGDPRKFIAYGIYSSYSNSMTNQKYKEVVQKTNGKIYNLESTDYGVLLSELGKDLVSKTTGVFPIVMLDQKPKIGTIVVSYKGRILTPGTEWIYNPQFNYVQIQDPSILDSKTLDLNVSFEIDRE